MRLTAKRAAAIAALLIAAGVLAQLTGLVGLTAAVVGIPPERLGYDAGALLTARKLGTAAAFAVVCAIAWGLLRRDAGTRLLQSIPPMSATGVGFFRIVLAAALVWALIASGPISPAMPSDLQRDPGPFAGWEWARALALHEGAGAAMHAALLAAIVVFGAGLFTRAALVATALLATVTAMVLLQRQSAHDWGLPVVILWLITIVPWGDGLSVDALVRRRRGRPLPARSSSEYGLAVWIPGFALGVAFLAAAFAKLDTSGLSWIADGAVRYHFIEDARQAPVDWGLRIAVSDTWSRLASLAAVGLEASVILHVFARGWRARMVFGLLAALLLTGFFLFQGVTWRLWWVWLLAWLPWEPWVAWMRGRASRDRWERSAAGHSVGPRRWQIAVLSAFALQQVIFSGIHLEFEPFASDYGMYAFTWPSREAFEAHLVRKLRTVRVEQTPEGPRTIIEEPVFDWSRGAFAPPRVIVEGPQGGSSADPGIR